VGEDEDEEKAWRVRRSRELVCGVDWVEAKIEGGETDAEPWMEERDGEEKGVGERVGLGVLDPKLDASPCSSAMFCPSSPSPSSSITTFSATAKFGNCVRIISSCSLIN
jgi:hypothetical protein